MPRVEPTGSSPGQASGGSTRCAATPSKQGLRRFAGSTILTAVYAAVFALAGTALGIGGTLLADLIRARTHERRERREQLRSACVDLATALVEIRQAYWGRAYVEDGAVRRAALQRAHDAARANYERLRLSTSSLAVQEEARFALRYAYGLLREFEGLPPRPDELDSGPIDQLDDRLVRLYTAVRRELGTPDPQRVLSERAFLGSLPPDAAVD
jgi:hypothetical protein